MVREVLNEVKANGVGDNKNVLIELNIEQTRHNEIQLLGNGEWCVSLGGRDCSLQMHEQKLLEVSVTKEGLAAAIARAKAAGKPLEVKALEMMARIYSDTGRYNESLAAARTATRLQPNSEESRRGQDAASALFSELFLGAKGDDLPPVDALGMFYEFRELTPIG